MDRCTVENGRIENGKESEKRNGGVEGVKEHGIMDGKMDGRKGRGIRDERKESLKKIDSIGRWSNIQELLYLILHWRPTG